MQIAKAIFLGFVQGFTEFLPVSSSGHLVLFSELINFSVEEGGLFFDVMLHLGTLFSVIVAMRKEIWQMLKAPFSKYTGLLVVATVPAGVFGLLFLDYFEGAFDIRCVPVGFYVTGMILLMMGMFTKIQKNKEVDYKSAIAMGGMQVLALFPGVSRSGSTIFGGVATGLSREKSAKFSFIMALPIILASAILKIYEVAEVGIMQSTIVLSICGGISAFIFGMLGIKFLLKIIQRGKLQYFAYYLFVLASLLILI